MLVFIKLKSKAGLWLALYSIIY